VCIDVYLIRLILAQAVALVFSVWGWVGEHHGAVPLWLIGFYRPNPKVTSPL